jgi:hypothetical protein
MNDSLTDKLAELQNQYYETNKKNTFFKNSQKKDCANIVLNNVSIQELLNRTAYVLPNSNKVYIDYPILKTYSTDETYATIMTHICELFKQCIQTYGVYECHLNLLSCTVSACERNKGLFYCLFDECRKNDDIYTTMISSFYIYNTPNTMSSIIQLMTPLMSPVVKNKIKLFDKIESPSMILSLHQNT